MMNDELMERNERMLTQIMRAIEGGRTECAYCGTVFDANPGDCYCGDCLTKFYGI